MIQLLISLLPLAVAAAITPTTWGLVILLLNRTPTPLRSSFALLAGPILYIFFLSIIAYWTSSPIHDILTQGSQGNPEKHFLVIIAKFGLSILFLYMAIYTVFARPNLNRQAKWQKDLERLSKTNPWMLFGVSLLIQIPRWKTLALFFSALMLIDVASIGPLERLIALLAYVAIAYSAYVIPFIFILISPQKAIVSLQKGINILGKKAIMVTLYLFLSFFFLQSGIQALH